MWKEAKWLKVPAEEIVEKRIYHGDMTGRFAYFRCDRELPENAHLSVDITASSRYRLWVNEIPVLSGPCKGDTFRQYYETVELTEYLHPGKNVFCVQVLYCDPDTAEIQTDERASIYGVIGPRAGHRLAIEGDALDENGSVINTVTTGKADWRVYLENSFYLKSTEITLFLGAVVEEIDTAKSPLSWKKSSFDVSGWKKADCTTLVKPTDLLHTVLGVEPRFRIREREIPLLYEREESFMRDFGCIDGKSVGLLENGYISISPGESFEVILETESVKNGYPAYSFTGGRNARVMITYFEKFGGQGSDLSRRDYKHGEVSGLTDTLILNGEPVIYEPFWVRTFRFICIRIHASEEAVRMEVPVFRRTGYPLPIESSITSSAPWVGKLWDMCVRTLENCMLETYMDCPYYEQLQFGMDTRLEALFTYAVSQDAAMARKALIDFHYGMQPEGLTSGKYPSVYLQILSTFSLHYVYMMWEYYQQTWDMETLRTIRGDIDRILDYYDEHIGEDGLVGRLEYWEFVDWLPVWEDCSGTPRALQYGSSTIINLMYAYALYCGERLQEIMGRPGLASEYHDRREKLLNIVQETCWDPEKGMYREGPLFEQFTQHAQAWAVLNGLAEGEQARRILANAIRDKDCLHCTFSTAYEWFRALAKTGMYEEMRDALQDWIDLIDLECTTCPETPRGARSENHAWSALPMFELVRTVAGVEPGEEGWQQMTIAPHMMDLNDAEGNVITPYGSIAFSYKRVDGKTQYSLTIPEGITAEFCHEDGRREKLTGSQTWQE